MDTDTTETGASTETGSEEGGAGETITLTKSDYDKLNQTLGSLKRENKDLKKPKEETKDTSQTKPEEFGLVQKSYLRAAGITNAEEVELALTTSKKWGMELDQLVDDDDFKVKLEKLRTTKSNEAATANVRGGTGPTQAKLTPEYWIAKGVPPTTADVPDRKTRVKIARAMMASSKDSKVFYND